MPPVFALPKTFFGESRPTLIFFSPVSQLGSSALTLLLCCTKSLRANILYLYDAEGAVDNVSVAPPLLRRSYLLLSKRTGAHHKSNEEQGAGQILSCAWADVFAGMSDIHQDEPTPKYFLNRSWLQGQVR